MGETTPERVTVIDREAGDPPYRQLAHILEHRLASGEVRPGSRLPSEGQLCRRFSVSPMTVRRAIGDLVARGLVETIPGSGTYARRVDLSVGAFTLEPFRELISVQGTRVELLQARIVRADDRVAAKLDMLPGSRAILLLRRLCDARGPVLLHREHLVYDPTRPIVEGEMDATNLRGLLCGGEETGLKGGRLALEATTLQAEDVRLVGSSVGSPAFRLVHRFFGFDDRPISWGWFLVPGERLRFVTSVGLGDEREGG